MKDAILVISDKNKILFTNENALEEFGESLVGKKCYEALWKHSKPCEFCPSKKFSTREQNSLKFEKTLTSPSTKEIKNYEINASYVEDFYDTPAIVEIFRDITERKKAEEKDARKTAIMNAINDVFYEALICESEEELGKICLEIAQNLSGAKFGSKAN